jgi:hypothetical protein
MVLVFGVFNATFSNISAISWRPVLVVEEAFFILEKPCEIINGKISFNMLVFFEQSTFRLSTNYAYFVT